MLVRFELIRADDAFNLAQKLVIAVSLAIYLAILIIPGRGVMKNEEARWLAIFFLVIAGLLLLIISVFLPALIKFLRWTDLFSDEAILFIARLGLVQAIIGVLALLGKSVALFIPYIKKYVARLSDLSGFHRGNF